MVILEGVGGNLQNILQNRPLFHLQSTRSLGMFSCLWVYSIYSKATIWAAFSQKPYGRGPSRWSEVTEPHIYVFTSGFVGVTLR
ncbi:hypothetical protein FKM82_002479 [Ascaphus truei]